MILYGGGYRTRSFDLLPSETAYGFSFSFYIPPNSIWRQQLSPHCSLHLNCGRKSSILIFITDKLKPSTDKLIWEIIMFDIISFFVGDKSIEINGTAFPLGELTTQTLNITKPEFSEMYHLAESAFETIYKNKTPPSKEEWNDCNNKYPLPMKRRIKFKE